jgi:hypothetical protein
MYSSRLTSRPSQCPAWWAVSGEQSGRSAGMNHHRHELVELYLFSTLDAFAACYMVNFTYYPCGHSQNVSVVSSLLSSVRAWAFTTITHLCLSSVCLFNIFVFVRRHLSISNANPYDLSLFLTKFSCSVCAFKYCLMNCF